MYLLPRLLSLYSEDVQKSLLSIDILVNIASLEKCGAHVKNVAGSNPRRRLKNSKFSPLTKQQMDTIFKEGKVKGKVWAPTFISQGQDTLDF